LVFSFLAWSAKIFCMKKLFTIFILIASASTSFSQIILTTLPSGGNKKASVTERVGITDITIHFDRPGVKGREGKIWGQLIPVGYTDQGFGSSKAAPWRAGSNENTTMEFSDEVKIEGKPLAAGKYGFFVAYDPNECTLIFSKNSSSWGSFFYDEKEDAIRVKVKPVALDKSVEWLKYEFMNETENSATIALQWEKLMIPFKVEVDYVKTQLESFRKELRTSKGFQWESWNQAAQWAVQHNVNLNEALLWADTATSVGFGGSQSFQAWSTKAQVLDKLGRGDEATAIMKKAMPFATMNDIHGYGRSLLQQKKNKEALEIFKMNYEKNPNQFTTLVGLTRGYSANGDYKSALKYANEALPLAPNEQNKNNVLTMIDKLKNGKDVN
jgi:tetratricopeptide (TPR) repeat protein